MLTWSKWALWSLLFSARMNSFLRWGMPQVDVFEQTERYWENIKASKDDTISSSLSYMNTWYSTHQSVLFVFLKLEWLLHFTEVAPSLKRNEGYESQFQA